MALQLNNLGPLSGKTLIALATLAMAKSSAIATCANLKREQVSSALNRLESMGLVEKPEISGGEWRILDKGYGLLQAAGIALTPAVSPIPPTAPGDEEPLPPVEEEAPHSVDEEDLPPTDEELLPTEHQSDDDSREAQIDRAFSEVKSKLRNEASWIPPKTCRLYRELIALLPPILQEELAPITCLLRREDGEG